MQPQQAILKFSEAERPFGDRLLKIAVEIDRVEGYSEPHAIMIARLAESLGARMGLHGSDLSALKFAALLHDVGERVMKRNYLLRPDDLTWEETLDLWRHSILGEQAASELRLARQIQLLIRWHHEWWNGLGYPDGLAGELIPLGARILRVADTYCALISNRPHRQRFEALEAEQIIADLAGIEFDPQIVSLLLAFLAQERRNRETQSDIDASEIESQIILTPGGLQTAFVESATQSVPADIEASSTDIAADLQIVELADDVQDEVRIVTEQETLRTIDSEILIPLETDSSETEIIKEGNGSNDEPLTKSES